MEKQKYKTLKIPLKLIFNNTYDNELLLQNNIIKTHKLTILSYQFLRLWILHKYYNNLDLPIITKQLICITFNILSEKYKDPRLTSTNSLLFDELKDFYNTYFKHFIPNNNNDTTNISQILSYNATEMITNIENNIKMHFFSHINRFVNQSFEKLLCKDIFDKIEEKEQYIINCKNKLLNFKDGIKQTCDKTFKKQLNDDYKTIAKLSKTLVSQTRLEIKELRYNYKLSKRLVKQDLIIVINSLIVCLDQS